MSNDLHKKIQQIAAAKGIEKQIVQDLQQTVTRQRDAEKKRPKNLQEAAGVLDTFFGLLKGTKK